MATTATRGVSAAAWIDERFLVTVSDPPRGFPVVSLAHGGSFDRRHCYRQGEDGEFVLRNKELGVGQKVKRTIGQVQFEIERENNINQDILFRVRVRKP